MSLQEFISRVEELGEMIKSWDENIHITYKLTPDGLIAASCLGRTFFDLQKSFSLSSFERIPDILHKVENSFVVLIGASMEDLKELKDIQNFLIIVDPIYNEVPFVESETIKLVNSGDFGYIYPESTLTAITYFISSSLTSNVDYIVRLPLIALQTRELFSDPVGLTDFIAQDAIDGKIIENSKEMSILGSGIYNISEAIVNSFTPFLPGLTGNELAVSKLFAKSGVEIETKNAKRKLAELSKDEITDLNSNLIKHLAEFKGYQEDQLVFIKTKTKFLDEERGTFADNTWDMAVGVLDALNKGLISDTAAFLMGNRSKNLQLIKKTYHEERKAVPGTFQLMMDHKDEVIELEHLKYFYADRKLNWYNTSITAAMALSNGMVTTEVPFLVISPGPGTLSTIGIRASKKHKLRLGLQEIVQRIVTEAGIETTITGSKLAAQFSVPKNSVDHIVKKINTQLGDSA